MNRRSRSECLDNLPRAFTKDGVLLGIRRLFGRLAVVGARIDLLFAMLLADLISVIPCPIS
jgi:hypothetical protein